MKRPVLLDSNCPSDNVSRIKGVVRLLDEMIAFHDDGSGEMKLSPDAKSGLITVFEWIGDGLEGVERQLGKKGASNG